MLRLSNAEATVDSEQESGVVDDALPPRFHAVAVSDGHTATVLTTDGQRTPGKGSFLLGRTSSKVGTPPKGQFDNVSESANRARSSYGRSFSTYIRFINGWRRRRDGATTSCRVMHDPYDAHITDKK